MNKDLDGDTVGFLKNNSNVYFPLHKRYFLVCHRDSGKDGYHLIGNTSHGKGSVKFLNLHTLNNSEEYIISSTGNLKMELLNYEQIILQQNK